MSFYEYARKEFEKFYDCNMTIFENKPVKEGSITRNKWVEVEGLVDQPCRIAQKQLNASGQGEASNVNYQLMLHCNPLLDIPAGSRISITNVHGEKRDYKRSSEAFSSYRTHQEIAVVRDVKA